jgi:two-component system NtrC family sensor kinase
MPPTENERPADARAPRLTHRLGTKLIIVLLAATLLSFASVGYLNFRLHRRHLEESTQRSAERISDVIKRSTSYYMLRNDREGLYHIIGTMADEPGMVRIRIFNQEGRISFSTHAPEANTYVEKDAEACYACHAAGQPLSHLDRPDRIRIYHTNGSRVLGIINPIENKPECSNAACHAHPASQKILGVLDATLSLAQADAQLAESSQSMLAHTVLAAALVSGLIGLVVWWQVGRPLKLLKAGTERLANGELGYQIRTSARDEIGEVASSLNEMSRELAEARESLTSWAKTLETRVEQKTRELKAAHEQMLQAEKLASIGKLAAVVAHEINNPLSGMLTYTKLVRRWLESAPQNGGRQEEVLHALELMESEIRRCGEIVRNMLTFSRALPLNLEWTDLHAVIGRVVRLVQHKLELGGIQLHLELQPDLPRVHCDAAQAEQLLLALVMNAIEAMPRGGNLWLRTRAAGSEAQIEVQDDGAGIPPEMLPHMFEPFQTTKERGVGLGLAVTRQIVERHQGRIEVQSQPGRGTTFLVTLALEPQVEEAAKVR